MKTQSTAFKSKGKISTGFKTLSLKQFHNFVRKITGQQSLHKYKQFNQ